jgi:hypothetical protein
MPRRDGRVAHHVIASTVGARVETLQLVQRPQPARSSPQPARTRLQARGELHVHHRGIQVHGSLVA